MGKSDNGRLTPAEGRRFGLTLALGFGAVGALLAWRGLDTAARVCWSVAAVAAVAGVVVPGRLGPVQRVWMAFGVALSRVVRPVFFTVMYFGVITPAGVVRRVLGRSPLKRDPSATSYWQRRTGGADNRIRRSMERQF